MKKVRGSYLFKIKTSDGKIHEWLVDLSSGSGSVKKGTGMIVLNCLFLAVCFPLLVTDV